MKHLHRLQLRQQNMSFNLKSSFNYWIFHSYIFYRLNDKVSQELFSHIYCIFHLSYLLFLAVINGLLESFHFRSIAIVKITETLDNITVWHFLNCCRAAFNLSLGKRSESCQSFDFCFCFWVQFTMTCRIRKPAEMLNYLTVRNRHWEQKLLHYAH